MAALDATEGTGAAQLTMSAGAPIILVMRGRTAMALTFLAGLLFLRVLGQGLVAGLDVPWLPPMDGLTRAARPGGR